MHHMWLRLTIDLDMMIHDAEAVTDSGPVSDLRQHHAQFQVARRAEDRPRLAARDQPRLGGIKGCTHLVELLGPLGTTAYQATGRARDARNKAKPPTGKKPYQLGSCHVYADDSPAVLRALAAVLYRRQTVTQVT